MASKAVIRLLGELEQSEHRLRKGREHYTDALRTLSKARSTIRRQSIRKYKFRKTG